jgi:hypothetical protein
LTISQLMMRVLAMMLAIMQKLILANYKHQPGKTGQCTDVGTVITSFSLFQLELLGESFLKLAVQGDQERNLFDHIA